MNLPEHFQQFLEDVVNLNKTRIDQLEEKVENIKNFIRLSEWEPEIVSFDPQGSWAHETIIKPVEFKGFDADLIVMVNHKDGLQPKDYINGLANIFRRSGIYAEKTTSYSHCVTIEYAGDFSIDIAPCILNRQGYSNKEVCNRTDDEFQITEPTEYTKWIAAKNEIAGGDALKQVTRLIKYLRDIKKTFSCPSVLLTTLIANQVYLTDAYGSSFTDAPSALTTVFRRLDDWLQSQIEKPSVQNPALPSEDFSELWTEAQYKNFREVINRYRQWIDEAVTEEDYVESIKKWRRVFQDDFAKGEAVSKVTKTLKALAEGVRAGLDFVEAVKIQGVRILDRMPTSFPHMEVTPFKEDTNQISVKIIGYEKLAKTGSRLRTVSSGEPLQKMSGIEFHATQASGIPFSTDFFIKWQVVNTDEAAVNDNCLRGDFYDSDTHGYRWEGTKYRGVHWVQAFVINKRTQKVQGKSNRFFVVVE